MGTRGLTSVIMGGQTKVAQYGQWDHYPEGQGITVLKFLQSEASVKALKDAMKRTRFYTKEEKDAQSKWIESIGSKGRFMTGEQSKKLHRKYPLDTRDHGAKILNKIVQCKEKEILLNDESNFLNEFMLCEWAYTIDFDKNKLLVYKEGPNLVGEFDLSNLPNDKDFVLILDSIQDNEDDF